MPSAAINGQRLHFSDTAGRGPVVVFSHGLLMDGAMFEPQVQALSARYRCITWDQRCHGATVTSPEPFSYWNSAADLVSLLDHLGVERAALVGMSQGGFLSQRAAIASPERVAGLFLIDTQAGPEEEEQKQTYRLLIDRVERGGVDQRLAEGTATVILGQGWDGAEAWIEKWRAVPATLWRQMFETLMSREDLTPRLPEIDSPAMAVHGSDDLAIPVAKAAALCRGIRGCPPPLVVPGAGHASNLTHPDPVNRALDGFLLRLQGDGSGSAWA